MGAALAHRRHATNWSTTRVAITLSGPIYGLQPSTSDQSNIPDCRQETRDEALTPHKPHQENVPQQHIYFAWRHSPSPDPAGVREAQQAAYRSRKWLITITIIKADRTRHNPQNNLEEASRSFDHPRMNTLPVNITCISTTNIISCISKMPKLYIISINKNSLILTLLLSIIALF